MTKPITFNPQEEEMIESFIRIMERVLHIEGIIWIRDIRLMKERTGIKKLGEGFVGACLPSIKYIWLDPVYHLNRPIREIFVTVTHEMIHIKHPTMSENDVIKLTESYTGIRDELEKNRKAKVYCEKL